MLRFLFAAPFLFILVSCGTLRPCTSVGYYSIRPTELKNPTEIPEDASIMVFTSISGSGDVNVIVRNLTDEVMTIDQTKTFFINNGRSTAYYDPTVRTTSNTVTNSASKGASFNLGGLASAFGIGGIAGTLMNATTVGGSKGIANSNTYTEVVADLPHVSIGPRGEMALSKTFKFDCTLMPNSFASADYANSPMKFTISINYSTDNGETWNKITSDYYCNSALNVACYDMMTNQAVRDILKTKPNATLEPWYRFYSNRGDQILNKTIFVNYN